MNSPVQHFDIGVKDKAKMSEFYCKTFGWSTMPSGPYSNAVSTGTDEGIQGAITALGHEPHNYVMIYMSVDSLEGTLKSIEESGGTTVIGPVEVPEQGRFAWFKDPEGNLLGLWQHNQD